MLIIHPSSTCDVCLDGYTWELDSTGAPSPERTPHAISCGHIFCKRCLDNVNPPHCPLCRKRYLPDRVKKLHLSAKEHAEQEAKDNEMIYKIIGAFNAPEEELLELSNILDGYLSSPTPTIGSSRSLRRARTALGDFQKVKTQKHQGDIKIHTLEKLLSKAQNSAAHDRDLSKAVEESLLAQVQNLTDQMTELQTTLTQNSRLDDRSSDSDHQRRDKGKGKARERDKKGKGKHKEKAYPGNPYTATNPLPAPPESRIGAFPDFVQQHVGINQYMDPGEWQGVFGHESVPEPPAQDPGPSAAHVTPFVPPMPSPPGGPYPSFVQSSPRPGPSTGLGKAQVDAGRRRAPRADALGIGSASTVVEMPGSHAQPSGPPPPSWNGYNIYSYPSDIPEAIDPRTKAIEEGQAFTYGYGEGLDAGYDAFTRGMASAPVSANATVSHGLGLDLRPPERQPPPPPRPTFPSGYVSDTIVPTRGQNTTPGTFTHASQYQTPVPTPAQNNRPSRPRVSFIEQNSPPRRSISDAPYGGAIPLAARSNSTVSSWGSLHTAQSQTFTEVMGDAGLRSFGTPRSGLVHVPEQNGASDDDVIVPFIPENATPRNSRRRLSQSQNRPRPAPTRTQTLPQPPTQAQGDSEARSALQELLEHTSRSLTGTQTSTHTNTRSGHRSGTSQQHHRSRQDRTNSVPAPVLTSFPSFPTYSGYPSTSPEETRFPIPGQSQPHAPSGLVNALGLDLRIDTNVNGAPAGIDDEGRPATGIVAPTPRVSSQAFFRAHGS